MALAIATIFKKNPGDELKLSACLFVLTSSVWLSTDKKAKKNLPEGRFEKLRDLDQSIANLICLPSLIERAWTPRLYVALAIATIFKKNPGDELKLSACLFVLTSSVWLSTDKKAKKNLPEGRFEKLRDLDQSIANLICLPSLTERV